MPRVHTRTRKRAEVKHSMHCTGPCKVAQERDGDTEIRVGDEYYTWSRKMSRGGITYFKHVACGRPRPTQLSSRKTAVIDEAQNDTEWPDVPSLDFEGFEGDPTQFNADAEAFVEACREAAQTIGEVAREVGSEYQDAFDNMPEGLNQGETGQALEEVAQELESWADEIESWEPSSTEPDWPDPEGYPDDDEGRESLRDDIEATFGSWADDVLSEAQDATSEYPEYNG
jgi:hypothetical protein